MSLHIGHELLELLLLVGRKDGFYLLVGGVHDFLGLLLFLVLGDAAVLLQRLHFVAPILHDWFDLFLLIIREVEFLE